MATSWENLEKPTGITGGWQFNESNMSFNQIIDPDTGNMVYFNGVGLPQVWTNLPKT